MADLHLTGLGILLKSQSNYGLSYSQRKERAMDELCIAGIDGPFGFMECDDDDDD